MIKPSNPEQYIIYRVQRTQSGNSYLIRVPTQSLKTEEEAMEVMSSLLSSEGSNGQQFQLHKHTEHVLYEY